MLRYDLDATLNHSREIHLYIFKCQASFVEMPVLVIEDCTVIIQPLVQRKHADYLENAFLSITVLTATDKQTLCTNHQLHWQ